VSGRRPRAPRLSSLERRALLVEAAVRVLLRRGVQGTQVSHVVREAGVSRGTFYKHFDSKRHLVGAAARELLDRMLPRFPRPPALSTRADFEAALTALHRHVLSAAAKERATARLILVGGGGAEPTAARWIATHEESWRRLVATIVARARAARLVRDGIDPSLAIAMIVGSVQHVLRTSVLRRAGDPDCDALALGLARLHANALAP
jgi:AcrR family transcriptional regulator